MQRKAIASPTILPEGRPILCLQRTCTYATGQKPLILILAGEHASEFAGEWVARGMLSAVLDSGPVGNALKERFDWGFILNANPDGNVNGWHQYNVTDWEKHIYPLLTDISWHHQYGPYFDSPTECIAVEAMAIGNWVLTHRPAFIFNMHSWEGHGGNIGAYRASASEENHPQLMAAIDAIAKEVAQSIGVTYTPVNAQNLRSGHLGDTLASVIGIPSLAPEAHMSVGANKLYDFGAQWLQRCLDNPSITNALSEIAAASNDLYRPLLGRIKENAPLAYPYAK